MAFDADTAARWLGGGSVTVTPPALRLLLDNGAAVPLLRGTDDASLLRGTDDAPLPRGGVTLDVERTRCRSLLAPFNAFKFEFGGEEDNSRDDDEE